MSYPENFGNTSNLRISADVEADADDAFANSLWYVELVLYDNTLLSS
jgi:hypothetical protein